MQVVLIDMNNLGFAAMSEPRLVSGERETQAIFSVIKRIRFIMNLYPNCNIIGLYDGRSWRKDIYPDYKANREKTDKAVEVRSRYYEQKDEIMRGLSLLGVRQIWGTNMEADDIASILSTRLSVSGHKVTLITADKDWQQLVSENVNWFDIIHSKMCDSVSFKEVTGYINDEQFIEAKCVLGDPSDNIKGINFIGPVTLKKIYDIYPRFSSFIAALRFDKEFVAKQWKDFHGSNLPKTLRELDCTIAMLTLESNQTLIDLSTPNRPKPETIIDMKGKLDKNGFTDFCLEHAFGSIIRDTTFLSPFERNIYISK